MTDEQEFLHLMARHELKQAGADPCARISATDLNVFAKGVGEVVGKLQARIQKLENQLKRLDDIEKSALTWRSDWERGSIYPQSVIVRHNGSLYVALLENINKEPGTGVPWSQI